ncbi:MAG: hypothetical protein KDA72_23290, partial [Planctomycetales bacterium]|nr:hypothetical protein [Planctomycetales bacterium]
MGKATDINLKTVENSTRAFQYRQPMKFGGRVVEDVCVLRTEVSVTQVGGRKKTVGVGEMTMGNAWAWPSKIPSKITLKLLIELAKRLAARAQDASLTGDPLQITHRIGKLRDAISSEMV